MDKSTISLETEALFKKYRRLMYALALSISRNAADAEDILQNAFLQVYKHIDSFKGASRVSTWIYRITYNEALMYLRKKYRNFRVYSDLKGAVERDASWLFINWSKLPDEQLIDDEFKERLESAIRAMPIKYRMPLLLHTVEGMPLKEAALVLRLGVNSLKTRLHRAHLMVGKELAGYFRDEAARGKDKEPAACSIWNKFVYGYASEQLDKRKCLAFDRHIGDCPGCKSFLAQYRRAIRITKALQCKDMPPELKDKIQKFLAKPCFS